MGVRINADVPIAELFVRTQPVSRTFGPEVEA